MAADKRVALIRRWFEEVWNQSRFEVLDEITTPDITYLSMLRAPVEGLESLKLYTSVTRLAYPDLQVTIYSIELQADRAVVSLSIDGLTSSPSGGLLTGSQELHARFLATFWFREGKIAQVRMQPEGEIPQRGPVAQSPPPLLMC